MSLVINKQMLAAAYDYLRHTKPFAAWRLPPSSDVVFGIIPNKDRCAHHFIRPDGRDAIEFSIHWNTRHVFLLSTMAHEMAHLYLHKIGRHSMRNPHNAAFQRVADRICRHHIEFDRWAF